MININKILTISARWPQMLQLLHSEHSQSSSSGWGAERPARFRQDGWTEDPHSEHEASASGSPWLFLSLVPRHSEQKSVVDCILTRNEPFKINEIQHT